MSEIRYELLSMAPAPQDTVAVFGPDKVSGMAREEYPVYFMGVWKEVSPVSERTFVDAIWPTVCYSGEQQLPASANDDFIGLYVGRDVYRVEGEDVIAERPQGVNLGTA